MSMSGATLERLKCRSCGGEIAHDVSFQQCPKCLLDLGLAFETVDGVRIPGNSSRIEPLNHPLTRPSATLSSTGGEGGVSGQRATGRFMGSAEMSDPTL